MHSNNNNKMATVMALVVLAVVVALCHGKPLSELKNEMAKIDTENVDCKSWEKVIDECGLQQGNSHRFPDFAYPTNHSELMVNCRRQTDALKCLKAYSRCLDPMGESVLKAMVTSRNRFNKKMCQEKPTETATKFLELSQCMSKSKSTQDKANKAEVASILVSEAIVSAKLDTVQDRLKHSCCSVAKLRKEFMESAAPDCERYSGVASEIIDSYLADTVGIVCPNMEAKLKNECDKLPKLSMPTSTNSRFFVRPILKVVQTLGMP